MQTTNYFLGDNCLVVSKDTSGVLTPLVSHRQDYNTMHHLARTQGEVVCAYPSVDRIVSLEIAKEIFAFNFSPRYSGNFVKSKRTIKTDLDPFFDACDIAGLQGNLETEVRKLMPN